MKAAGKYGHDCRPKTAKRMAAIERLIRYHARQMTARLGEGDASGARKASRTISSLAADLASLDHREDALT